MKNHNATKGTLVIDHFRLPNVKSVKVIEGGLHDWLANFGIISKSTSRKLELLKYSRTGNHRYLAYMENKLEKLAKDRSPKYWKVAEHFLGHSNLLFIWSMRSVELNWHRKWSTSKVLTLWKEWRIFFGTLDGHIKLARVWIQSPAYKERGLSVPALEYRITAAAMTKILELWVTPIYAKWQHAYISNLGCGTAWRYFFKKIHGMENILEFDLNNFFPSVKHESLRRILREYGVSDFYTKWIMCIIKETLEMPKSLEIPDLATGAPTIKKKTKWDLLLHKNEPNKHKTQKVGVPMGIALAPLMAVLVLQYAIENKRGYIKTLGCEFVMYADDGNIGWTDSQYTYQDIMEVFGKHLDPLGIKVNMDKSKLLKWKGKWLHKIKFLGMVYDPFEDVWMSWTRKGQSLKLDLTALKVTQPEGKWIDNFIVQNFSRNSKYHKLFKWNKIAEDLVNPYPLFSAIPLKQRAEWIERLKWFDYYMRPGKIYLVESCERWTVVTKYKIGIPSIWEGFYQAENELTQRLLFANRESLENAMEGATENFVETNSSCIIDGMKARSKKTSTGLIEYNINPNDITGNQDLATSRKAWFTPEGWIFLAWNSLSKINYRRGWYRGVDYVIEILIKYLGTNGKIKNQWVIEIENHTRAEKTKPYQVLRKMVIGGVQMMSFLWVERREIIEDMYKWNSRSTGSDNVPMLEVASLNWRNVINSRYLGDIMARMYIGRWDVDMEQDFGLKYQRDSFMGMYEGSQAGYVRSLWREGLEMSVFTSTTITWQLLARTLDKIVRLQRGKWVGPEVLECLPSWLIDDNWIRKNPGKTYRIAKGKVETRYVGKLDKFVKENPDWLPIDKDRAYRKGKWWLQEHDIYRKSLWDGIDWWKAQFGLGSRPLEEAISKRKVRRQVKLDSIRWLYNLGLLRNGRPIAQDLKKSS
jgi:hypothetical protein